MYNNFKKRIMLFTVVFVFAMSFMCYGYPNISVANLSSSEAMIAQLGILKTDSCLMLVNGASRYIDDSDMSLTPKLIEATTYIPLKAAQTLFYAGVQKDNDNLKVDFNTDNHFFNAQGTQLTTDLQTKSNDFIIYIESKEYIPLRKVGEFLGKTVEYSDGCIIIGEQSDVTALLNDSASLATVEAKLNSFAPVSYEKHTYYVSNSGSNLKGDGSFENPYKTIEWASQNAQAGDDIIIRGGTYRETLVPLNNGTYTKPITYKSYKGEKVILSANEEISGFTATENVNIVSALFSDGLGGGRDQLFYKNKGIVEARFPNHSANEYDVSDLSSYFPVKGDLKVKGTSQSSNENDNYVVTGDILNGYENNYWQGATFVSLHGGGWVLGMGEIASSTSGSFTVDKSSATQNWWFEGNMDISPNYGYITNTKKAIDIPGEWAIENDNLYMYLPVGETASTLSVEMKKRQLCIDLKGKKYIHIDGIETIGGGINMNNSEMCILRNCNFKNISHYTTTKDQREGFLEDASPLNSNGAPFRGEMGIYISGKNDVVRNCKITESAAAGLYMTGLNTLVENNTILNTGYMGSTVCGIYIDCKATGNYNDLRGGYVIMNNTVRNSGRSAFSLQTYEPWVQKGIQAVYLPCEISYNNFVNGSLICIDTGVVYMWGATMGNENRKTKFHNNAVWMEAPGSERLHSMIYHDNFMNMMETYNNLVFVTNENVTFNNVVYVQRQSLFPTSYAVIDNHDNIDYGVMANGLNDIEASQYPGGRYFRTGSYIEK